MPPRFDLRLADCRDVLASLPDNSVDACITDAPYVLESIRKRFGSPTAAANRWGRDGSYARHASGFMGQDWDVGDVVHDPGFWREVLRVVKPGGWLVAFSSTRTQHRQTCAIEDAGWEIRDQIDWMFGTGMPKGQAWTHYKANRPNKPCAESRRMIEARFAGFGRATLKPAHEPICIARKELAEDNVELNMLRWGTGALNVDGMRLEPAGAELGRWPANVAHDGSPEVLEAFAAYGERGAQAPVTTRGAPKFRTCFGGFLGEEEAGETFQGDEGTADRFFYSAKATREDREEGCYHLPKRPLNWSSGDANPGSFQSAGTDKSAHNFHPTVKPTDLMRWLVRGYGGGAPDRVIFDPFMGSGSTGKACALEGARFLGADSNPDFMPIARARIAHAAGGDHDIGELDMRPPPAPVEAQGSLFG